jgi:hypothetical protein
MLSKFRSDLNPKQLGAYSMKNYLSASILSTLLVSHAWALDDPAPTALVHVDAKELARLNNQTNLLPLFVEVIDSEHNNSKVFDLSKELRLDSESFDPLTGSFIEMQPTYHDPGAVVFTLPQHFAPSSYRVYAEDTLGQQQSVNFTVEFSNGSEPVKQAQALVDGIPTLTTISKTGAAANRVDFVLVGDGYTKADLAKWQADAQKVIDGFFKQAPYSSYKNYFNIYRIDAFSKESGVDHPKTKVVKDTAFDAAYSCSGIERLICVSTSKVRTEVSKLLPSNAQEIVLVIVNDTQYGGSGGSVGVISMHSSSLELAQHELGHSFGRLTDEYVDTNVVAAANCNLTTEPSAMNASKLYSARTSIKWSHWIDASTVLPTPSSTTSTPGLYAGGQYCTGLYRPTPNSKMRTLGRPFDAVNEELLVLRIYDYVNLLESVSPSISQTVDLREGKVSSFSFQTMQPATAVTVAWYLDNVLIANTPTLAASRIPTGTHKLELVVNDPTPKVRKDTANKLTKRVVWQVIGSGSVSAPVPSTGAMFDDQTLTIPTLSLPTGESYEATLQLVDSSADMVFEVVDLQSVGMTAGSDDGVFADGILSIPEVLVGQQRYSVKLQQLPNTSPMRLQVIEAVPL